MNDLHAQLVRAKVAPTAKGGERVFAAGRRAESQPRRVDVAARIQRQDERRWHRSLVMIIITAADRPAGRLRARAPHDAQKKKKRTRRDGAADYYNCSASEIIVIIITTSARVWHLVRHATWLTGGAGTSLRRQNNRPPACNLWLIELCARRKGHNGQLARSSCLFRPAAAVEAAN